MVWLLLGMVAVDPTKAIDDDLDKIFSSWVLIYDRFINFVAESRSQSYEKIKEIAGEGSGSQPAQKNRLDR